MFETLPDQERLWAYNCLDCVYTREVGEAEAKAITSLGLGEVDRFQHRLFPAVLHAMLRGVRIDRERKATLSIELALEIEKRQKWFLDVLGHPLNPRSPKQMQALFYEDLRLPVVWRKTANGNVPTLDDKALEILRRKEPLVRPLIKTIQEFRSLGVFKSTFVDMALDLDGRMRCSYNICGQEGYRLSSSENAFGSGGNLQNIPQGGEDDESELELPNVRSLIVPDEGKEFFDQDLSKADLRVVVWEADEREMKAMLAEGRDPYVEVAREFHKDPSLKKTLPNGAVDPRYKMFKSFCHGSHYLGTPQGLSQRLGLTVHDADRTQKWYFGKYPSIPKWQAEFIEGIKRTRAVSNKFGFRRVFFGRIDDSVFREAIAWLPQSTVAIFINKVWVNLWERHRDLVEVLLQVHDSLAGQFNIANREKALTAIQECAQVVVPYEDPLIIPIGVKTSTKSWGDCQ